MRGDQLSFACYCASIVVVEKVWSLAQISHSVEVRQIRDTASASLAEKAAPHAADGLFRRDSLGIACNSKPRCRHLTIKCIVIAINFKIRTRCLPSSAFFK